MRNPIDTSPKSFNLNKSKGKHTYKIRYNNKISRVLTQTTKRGLCQLLPCCKVPSVTETLEVLIAGVSRDSSEFEQEEAFTSIAAGFLDTNKDLLKLKITLGKMAFLTKLV